MFFSFSSLLTCWKILVKKTVPMPSRCHGRSWKVNHKTRSTTGNTKRTNQKFVDTRIRLTLLELAHEESHKIVKRSQKLRKTGDNGFRSQMCCFVVKLLHSLLVCLLVCLFVLIFASLLFPGYSLFPPPSQSYYCLLDVSHGSGKGRRDRHSSTSSSGSKEGGERHASTSSSGSKEGKERHASTGSRGGGKGHVRQFLVCFVAIGKQGLDLYLSNGVMSAAPTSM